MAWEISIAAEGWQEIREKLEDWSREALIDAIADDKFEIGLRQGRSGTRRTRC